MAVERSYAAFDNPARRFDFIQVEALSPQRGPHERVHLVKSPNRYFGALGL